jgi:hypothetical protein
MRRLSRDARYLRVEALVWCNRFGTDGAIGSSDLRWITDSPDPEKAAAELVEAGYWTETGTGWQADWTDQFTAAQVQQERAAHAKHQQDYGRRGRLHQAGDHSLCTKNCPKSPLHTISEGLSDGISERAPSRPVPSPRRERERDRRGYAA